MNEALSKMPESKFRSFLKDDSLNRMMKHKKIYNLKLDYLMQYKPSLNSLRQTYLNERKRNRSTFTQDEQMRTFSVHQQSVSSDFIESRPSVSKSPDKVLKDSFVFYEFPNNEKKKGKKNFENLARLREFKNRCLFSPKWVYSGSPKIGKEEAEEITGCYVKGKKKKEKKMTEKQVNKNIVNIVFPTVSPGKLRNQLKKSSDAAIKGWDNYLSNDKISLIN